MSKGPTGSGNIPSKFTRAVSRDSAAWRSSATTDASNLGEGLPAHLFVNITQFINNLSDDLAIKTLAETNLRAMTPAQRRQFITEGDAAIGAMDSWKLTDAQRVKVGNAYADMAEQREKQPQTSFSPDKTPSAHAPRMATGRARVQPSANTAAKREAEALSEGLSYERSVDMKVFLSGIHRGPAQTALVNGLQGMTAEQRETFLTDRAVAEQTLKNERVLIQSPQGKQIMDAYDGMQKTRATLNEQRAISDIAVGLMHDSSPDRFTDMNHFLSKLGEGTRATIVDRLETKTTKEREAVLTDSAAASAALAGLPLSDAQKGEVRNAYTSMQQNRSKYMKDAEAIAQKSASSNETTATTPAAAVAAGGSGAAAAAGGDNQEDDPAKNISRAGIVIGGVGEVASALHGAIVNTLAAWIPEDFAFATMLLRGFAKVGESFSAMANFGNWLAENFEKDPDIRKQFKTIDEEFKKRYGAEGTAFGPGGEAKAFNPVMYTAWAMDFQRQHNVAKEAQEIATPERSREANAAALPGGPS